MVYQSFGPSSETVFGFFFNMDFCENEFRSLIPKLKNVTSQETLLFSPRNTLTAHQGAAPHTSNPWFRNLKIS